MENKIININFRTSNYTTRTETLDNKEYLVVPVIMMQTGVHSGSMGALYHSIEELGRPDWNNIPVVINHPMEGDTYISANAASVSDADRVGIIRNTHVVGEQLKAEAWLDVNKMVAHQPDLLHRINSGEIINVSVGVYTDTEEQTIIENGNSIVVEAAINHIPDHLAILPYDEGACSVADGCGIRVNVKTENNSIVNNKKGGQTMPKTDLFKELSAFKRDDLSTNELNQLLDALKPLNLGLLSTNVCSECLQANEEGVLTRINNLRRYLDGMDNSESTYYLEEVNNDNTIIYRVEGRNQRRGSNLYKQEYSVDSAGVITFVGEPKSVVRKVSYEVAVNTMKRTKFNTNEKEVTKMENVKKLANALIANTNTHYTEEDREWLETLSEDKLGKMTPAPVEVQSNAATEALSAEDKSALEFGKKQLKAHREGLIAKITANTAEGVWDDATLQGMNNDTLERIAKSIPAPQANNDSTGVYIAEGNAIVTNKGAEDALYPAGVTIE